MEKPMVLIVGGGALQVPLIHEAMGLGLEVAVTDGNEHCPARRLVEKFWWIDTYDVVAHAELGRCLRQIAGLRLRGVVTAGADVAPSVAAAAEEAGVPGIPLATALLTHDKRSVRDALEEAGLNCYQPRWDEYSLHRPPAPAEWPMPCVIKPTEERASRGVTMVCDGVGWEGAIEKVTSYGDVYMIEELLTGTEHSAEIIFGNNGEILWFNIVDRYFDYSGGIPIERGHMNPSLLGEREQQQILLMMLAAARALKVNFGAWKGDIIFTKDGPKILELCSRLSGGWESQLTSPITDRHPMRILLQLYCGMDIDPQLSMRDSNGYAACAAILTSQIGKIKYLPTLYDIGIEESIGTIRWHIKEGENINRVEHNGDRSGFFIIGNKALRKKGEVERLWEECRKIANKLAENISVS